MTTAVTGAGGGAAAMTTDEGRGRQLSHTDRNQPDAAGRGGPVADTAQGAKRPSRPSSGLVFAPALGAFFAALALLAFQLRAGQDPALGPAEPTAQVQQKPRKVLIRKVIRRVVVHHPPTSAPSSPAAVQTSAPQTTTPAPAPAAPAPAPAPLTTQSS
jgi:hypothetical protein